MGRGNVVGEVVVTIGTWLARLTLGSVSPPAISSKTRAMSDSAVRP